MIARLAYWDCKEEFWGRDAELFESGAVPIMRTYEGFVEAKLLGKAGETGRIALTIWADGEAYNRFASSADLPRITEMFAEMYSKGGKPAPQEFEVRAQGFPEPNRE
ncbi:MAG: hypothetical protein OXI87_18080 [Albidovulum sp.]|nr:hypothetical protein [Albidovulum sp.]MDE0532886.1 hypothetical protein [Albidovulum sp.]